LGGLPKRVKLGRLITPESFAEEREKIFRRAWLSIGHTHDLPHKGSWFVYDVPTFNTSLLVVRGEDDVVRAFHNICRHRGNKLVRAGAGCSRAFVCNFHGWSFTNEGKLDLVTDELQFTDIDKATLGLLPVTTEVWETFIFVNFDTSPRISLQTWLGDMYGQYAGYFETHEKIASYQTVMNCNWHIAVNSFTEGYHTLYLHKSTARDYQGGRGNPNRHRPSIELFERHHRYSAPGNPDHHLLPAEAVAAKYGRKMLPAFDFDMTGMPAGVNPSRFDRWAFDVVEFFPNFVMLTGNHWRGEIWFWPIDAGRTLVVNQGWAYRPKNLGERVSRAYFRARVRDVFREDINTLEAQQEMLSAGVLHEIVLSQQEIALQHHYKVTADMLGEAS
ncbi:MAG: aromatic ring-hydroxylating dioxygenase subunit alpha, partial [Caulobacteraceae bacterium]|nr:aromatic ring-hydroxylating dioxygenase subunit alpha [Caulobacteraceae bacterium]